MPASTAWPILLAFGVTLCFASLVTSVGVGFAGVVLVCCGVNGWARQVLPEEHHELVPVAARKIRTIEPEDQGSAHPDQRSS